ncbi:helix-turn-helix domain-containing protein [Amycolatopsis mediterranei]|uniref:helix-turn-helix domain-containing protein n=1 Tax=Amycolatopsis mediterranei TaxID=33910 RepID=UPI00038DCE0E|nr:AraC family transcriptional regulator [Amycolatopsis mediterranei]AGT84188.1 AraC family transcriptional regulator [Amycolatopsis mediterranei RB]
MVFDSARFDLHPYAGFETDRFVHRTFCSWEHAGWRSLLVQRFEHVPVVEELALPAAADLHLVLPVSGRAELETRDGGRAVRDRWLPGRVQLGVPHQATVRRYRGDADMRSVQVHLPRDTVDSVVARFDAGVPDFEAMAASVATGDPLLEEAIRALGSAGAADDLYAETAAAFLATHLLSRHGRLRTGRPPAREDARVRAAVAFLRERLAEPVTLADVAGEVCLSVYHLVRVFRAATGQTPHRFLTGLRVEEAKRLLRGTDLALDRIAPRCGFTSPGALSAAFVRHTGIRPSVYRNS